VLSLALLGKDVAGPHAAARKAADEAERRGARTRDLLGGEGPWSVPAGSLLGPLVECLEADGKQKRKKTKQKQKRSSPARAPTSISRALSARAHFVLRVPASLC
jgi:hypothetical protein